MSMHLRFASIINLCFRLYVNQEFGDKGLGFKGDRYMKKLASVKRELNILELLISVKKNENFDLLN